MEQTRLNIIKEALFSYGASHLNKQLLDSISLEELFEISLRTDEERAAFRAAWALELILLDDNQLFLKHVDDALNCYYVSKNWSVLRSISKVVMKITKIDSIEVKEADIEKIIDKTFQILSDKDCPIAVRCNAYDILLNLSRNEKWIARELTIQINFDLEKNATPALSSRGTRILKKLERIF